MIRSVSAPPRPLPTRPQAAAVQATSVQPKGGGALSMPASADGWVKTGGDVAHWYNAGKTGLEGGRVANNAMGQIFKSFKGLKGNGIFNGLKSLTAGALPFMYRSAIFEGAISVVTNGYQLSKGRISFPEFGGRVVGDSISGLAGGAGAAVAGGLALALLPLTGTMATIVTAIAGIAGYSVAAGMIRQTSLYQKVVGTIKNGLR